MERQTRSIGRRLYGSATLWRDWEENGDDAVSPGYWELFVDLLLVAAASAMADVLLEDQSWHGFYEFLLLYMAMINGWLLYTHHYTSRFRESSLTHTLVLFFYLLGMAITIVNASYATAAAFSMGVILQRATWICMMVPIGWTLPRAKDFCLVICSTQCLYLLPHLVTAVHPAWARTTWTVAFVLDLLMVPTVALCLPVAKLIPINIEHTKDRLGVLVLIMLGETVISSTMTYREYATERDVGESWRYYVVLGLAFLLIFMLTLLYFHVQPEPRDHALRLSKWLGTLLMLLNLIMGMTLLTLGVSIKLVVHAVAEDEDLSTFSQLLLTRAVGSALVLLLLSRLCHFGGRIPRATDPPHVKRLMRRWWVLFAAVSVTPFYLPNLSQPIWSLASISGLLLSWVLLESWFSHTLEEHLPGASEESQPLTVSTS